MEEGTKFDIAEHFYWWAFVVAKRKFWILVLVDVISVYCNFFIVILRL
jgi:hypothetical protein